VKLSGIAHLSRWTSLLALALAATLGAAGPVRAETLNEAAWKPGAQWMSLRFGYAKAQGRFDPNGNVGWGFGYTRVVSKRLSLGANFQQELLGKFAGSALIELPTLFEAQWHFTLKTSLRPYVGAGVGGVYRKTYRTGADHSEFEPEYAGLMGANVPIDKSHLFGLDLRVAAVSTDQVGPNPVFGDEKTRSVHWGIKFTYALTY
jgi:hypothetical protein